MSNKSNAKPLITLTEAAAARINHLFATRDQQPCGIRIGVRQRGCSGNAYTLEFVENVHATDELVVSNNINVYIDPKALLFVIGTEMDYVDEKIQSGFKFRNPNEKGQCGCGESFYV